MGGVWRARLCTDQSTDALNRRSPWGSLRVAPISNSLEVPVLAVVIGIYCDYQKSSDLERRASSAWSLDYSYTLDQHAAVHDAFLFVQLSCSLVGHYSFRTRHKDTE